MTVSPEYHIIIQSYNPMFPSYHDNHAWHTCNPQAEAPIGAITNNVASKNYLFPFLPLELTTSLYTCYSKRKIPLKYHVPLQEGGSFVTTFFQDPLKNTVLVNKSTTT
jgi:hypothetical protein